MEVQPEEPVPESMEESVDDMELQEMVNRMMSMKEAEWVATSAIENPVIFVKLLEYSQSPDKKLAFHASWTLSKVCDRFPEMIVPYLSRIVEMLSQLKNESAERSFLRILSLSDMNNISIEQQGLLADHCFRALSSGLSAIAIKAYSMEILYKLSLKYPELANELSVSIRMLESEGSAGIMARGRMILKRLASIPVNTKSGKSLS
jgi:hypothetical protein